MGNTSLSIPRRSHASRCSQNNSSTSTGKPAALPAANAIRVIRNQSPTPGDALNLDNDAVTAVGQDAEHDLVLSALSRPTIDVHQWPAIDR